jgi:hypothetical protein
VRLELGAGARFVSQHLESKDGASVSEVERGPLLSLRLLHEGARFAIGGALEPTLWLSHAHGTASDGAQGSDRKALFALALALDLRVRLLSSVALRFAPGLEWLTTQQRYSVDGQVLSDLGRVRVLLPLSLFVGLPLQAGGTP